MRCCAPIEAGTGRKTVGKMWARPSGREDSGVALFGRRPTLRDEAQSLSGPAGSFLTWTMGPRRRIPGSPFSYIGLVRTLLTFARGHWA